MKTVWVTIQMLWEFVLILISINFVLCLELLTAWRFCLPSSHKLRIHIETVLDL
jgi:hypothetical protein